jgi:hypothetical protein
MQELKFDGGVLSSTRVREALQAAEKDSVVWPNMIGQCSIGSSRGTQRCGTSGDHPHTNTRRLAYRVVRLVFPSASRQSPSSEVFVEIHLLTESVDELAAFIIGGSAPSGECENTMVNVCMLNLQM